VVQDLWALVEPKAACAAAFVDAQVGYGKNSRPRNAPCRCNPESDSVTSKQKQFQGSSSGVERHAGLSAQPASVLAQKCTGVNSLGEQAQTGSRSNVRPAGSLLSQSGIHPVGRTLLQSGKRGFDARMPGCDLLTYLAASAQHFGGVVSVQRLRRAVARKELRAVKLGHRTVLFRPVDLDRWAESFAVEAMV
jgi:hypothetical protein